MNYSDLKPMFEGTGWKTFKEAIKEDYDRLSRIVVLDLVEPKQIESYKDICRAYDILINLEETELKKLRKIAKREKIEKKVVYE